MTADVYPLQPAEAYGLQVSPRCYVNVWYFTLVLRFFCCAFLSFTTFIYFYLAQPEMSYYAAMLGPSAASGLKPVGCAFACLVAAHTYDLVSMVWYSLQYDRLMYERDVNDKYDQMGLFWWLFSGCQGNRRRVRQDSSHGSSHNRHSSAHDTEAFEINDEDSYLVRASKTVQRLYLRLYGRQGIFGVDSKYFELNFAFRETTEIASQTFQAYSSSLLIASPAINTLYVTTIILNCWSGSIVGYFCRKVDAKTRRSRRVQAIPRRLSSQTALADVYLESKAIALERVCCLVTELLLDSGAAMLVPMIIFLPYTRVFDMQTSAFPVELLYNDVWFIELVMAAQQVFVVTAFDFVFTLIPHVGIYFGLSYLVSLANFKDPPNFRKNCMMAGCSKCKAKLARSQQRKRSSRTQVSHETSSSNGPSTDLVLRSNPLKVTIIPQTQNEPRIDRIAKKMLHAAFAFWGMVILLLHAASFLSFAHVQNHGCKQRVWPWLSFELPCSVFEYNCYHHNTTTIPENVFEGIEHEVLSILIIAHCPALVILTSIHLLTHLVGFEIYNSTIVDWSTKAAICESHHSKLKYVIIARSNMTRLPDGLLEPLPLGLIDIEIAVSNLTSLPDDLDQKWGHPLSTLFIEQCQLDEFPIALTRLDVKELSLSGNKLTFMDLVKLGDHFDKLTTLVLSGMPLRELPATMPPNIRMIELVSLENTQIVTLPFWTKAATMLRTTTTVFVSGTPFCASLSDRMIEAEYGPHAVISCMAQSAYVHGMFPLDLVTQMRVP